MENIIKSPLNYTGNKNRIFNQISNYFPKEINVMIDLFCGGGTVGLNTICKKAIFIDANDKVIGLLKFLSKQNIDDLIEKIENVISEYDLSNSYKYGYKKYRDLCSNPKDNNGLKEYNEKNYYRLRDFYNQLSDKDADVSYLYLYVLMLYAFNNDIRFNSDGNFNLPVGKTDFNNSNVKKLKSFINRVSNIECEFVCLDFTDAKMKEYVNEADFIYMDPPYLVGDAFYNVFWNNEKEYELLDFIDLLIKQRKNFALSNVMKKVGKINEPLSYWCNHNKDYINIVDIDYNYKSASYNKIIRDAKEREVLIINKE